MKSTNPEQQPEPMFPELILPEDIGEAILILENDVLLNSEQLTAQRRNMGNDLGKQISFVVAVARVKADIETLDHLYDVRDNGAILNLEEQIG